MGDVAVLAAEIGRSQPSIWRFLILIAISVNLWLEYLGLNSLQFDSWSLHLILQIVGTLMFAWLYIGHTGIVLSIVYIIGQIICALNTHLSTHSLAQFKLLVFIFVHDLADDTFLPAKVWYPDFGNNVKILFQYFVKQFLWVSVVSLNLHSFSYRG